MPSSATLSNVIDDGHASPRVRSAVAGDTQRSVALWLFACAALVFAMVVLGGVTRLTGSGLSMVHWRPVTGILPPMSAAAWQREFTAYRRSPEYQQVNAGMDLEGFKRIFWFEYAHRVLGRTVGLVFIVPLTWFALTSRLGRRRILTLLGVFTLGALQGVLGWYMVASGLVDVPQVSPYRLAAHLSLAVALYLILMWLGLSAWRGTEAHGSGRRGLATAVSAIIALVFLTLVSGAFVAGTKAGYAYSTFPKMGDSWVPAGMGVLEPGWRNVFENIAMVQFDHRVLAVLTAAAVIGLWAHGLRRIGAGPARRWLHLSAAAVAVQFALGVSTLLTHVAIPLAAAHQAGAVLLLTCLLGLRFELSRSAGARAPAWAR